MSDETAMTIYQGRGQALDTPIETPYQDVIPSLDQAIDDWIEESARSKSARTKATYRETITSFRAALRAKLLELDSSPVAITALARAWLNARPVAWTTFNQRRSILSSFYKYAIRNDIADIAANPIERIRSQKAGVKQAAARSLSDGQVKAGLSKIDRATVEGLRDYALLSVALTTGHRVSELAGLRLKHLRFDGPVCEVTWEHCKGNEQMRSRLERGVTAALLAYLTHEQVYGNRLLAQPGDAAVWLSFSDRNPRAAIGTRTISNICKGVFATGKVHTTRHTGAVNLAHAGASLEQIRQFLGHKNAKTTSDYLEEQLGYENPYAQHMEAAFGIGE